MLKADFKDYIKEILKTAKYKKDEEVGCVVAISIVIDDSVDLLRF